MDRSFEQIRSEVLELDHESQRRLVDEVEEKLAETELEFQEEWREEIKRRLDEYHRGEGESLTREEFMGRARQMIEDAKHVHAGSASRGA